MKSKQSITFSKLTKLYHPHISEWYYPWSNIILRMEAFPNSPEEYHLIANAANKYWNLIDV